MILISEEELEEIISRLEISAREQQILIAQIKKANQYEKEDSEESLLQALDNYKFDINSSIGTIETIRDLIEGVKGYLNNELTLDEAYDKYLNSGCPLFGYTWCERAEGCNIARCDSCDLKAISWQNGHERCKECWKRTLELERKSYENNK